MACRGPDAGGTWTGRHAALGHRRLAVIDLAGGAQPMTVGTDRGEVTLVYSGEVYNYVELRDELIRAGERFTTASDTEVVLRGYLRWGTGLADRLNGMYAFAIWDGREHKLVMIRDRVGIKPLYYCRTPDGVLFGSEQKAILANPLAPRVVDTEGLREALSYAFTPGHAIWAGLRQVEPGTIVTVDADGLHERTYWRLETRPHTADVDTSVHQVRELLDDTVRRQLVADVPRCLLLSGGLDSGALTALAAAHLAGERGADVRGRLHRPGGQLHARRAARRAGHAVHPRRRRARRLGPHRHRARPQGARRSRRCAGPLSSRATPRWASATWTSRCICCSRRSASSRRSPCRASRPTSCSAGTGTCMSRPSSSARAFPWIAVSVGPFDKDAHRHATRAAGAAASWRSTGLERYDSAVGEVERLDGGGRLRVPRCAS